MANEITVSLNVRVVNGAFDQTLSFSSQFDQTTLGGGGPGMVDIGTAEEVVAFADVTTPSLCVIQSLEAKGGNYVQFGATATTPTMATISKLFPETFSLLWLDPSITITAQANTAAVRVMFWVFEL